MFSSDRRRHARLRLWFRCPLLPSLSLSLSLSLTQTCATMSCRAPPCAFFHRGTSSRTKARQTNAANARHAYLDLDHLHRTEGNVCGELGCRRGDEEDQPARQKGVAVLEATGSGDRAMQQYTAKTSAVSLPNLTL